MTHRFASLHIQMYKADILNRIKKCQRVARHPLPGFDRVPRTKSQMLIWHAVRLQLLV
jgi:hypothetical protein